MSSVRGMLLLWLSPGFAVVLLLGGVSLFQSEKDRMEGDLESELLELSILGRFVVGPAPFGPPGLPRLPRREQDGEERVKAIEAALADPRGLQFFQQRNEAGERVVGSNSLSGRELRFPVWEGPESDVFEDVLEGGERVFCRAVRLLRRGEQSNAGVVFAVSCREIDAQLSAFRSKLIVGGVVSCIVLSGLLILALHFALKPVAEIGTRAAMLSVDSLHERFRVDSLPTELRPIASRLNDLMYRLEESFVRERRFSSDLAHEIRTPLTSILSMAEVAARWPNEKAVEDFEEIASVAKKMKSTINSLLMLARLEGKLGGLEKETILLEGVVEECLASCSELIATRSLDVTVEFEGKPEVRAEVNLLNAIVSNLLGNAVFYAPDASSVSIIVGGSALLRVINEAPYLKSEDVALMFDRLWRHDRARSDESRVGLGLSIAMRSAEVLGLELKAHLDESGKLEMSLLG